MGNSLSYETSECEVHLPAFDVNIRGVQLDHKSRRYAGVPYAEPPIGNLRWRRPQPVSRFPISYTSRDRIYDATKFGPVCPQASYSKTVSEHIAGHTYSEDCLYLNIWTPVPQKDKPNPKWPVMIWFHGGWFQVGDPSQEESMDPTELISTGGLNAIFVAVGYRLNVFGFLAGNALVEESNGEEVGNYGLWDQRLAIEWVHQNIAAFGGDPDNITLSGRSAGAYAVQAQALYSFRTAKEDASKNLFRRLVMYSNAIPTQPKTVGECQPQFDEICDYFGIDSELSGYEKLKILRDVKTADLCDAIMKLRYHTFRPITDSIFIRPGIFQYFLDGSFATRFKERGLRIFIGEVLNEETLYAVTNGPEANLTSLELQLSNYYSPATTSRLLNHYAVPKTDKKADWRLFFGQIVSDGQVRAPSRFLVNSLIQNGVDMSHIWRYLIAYRMSFITEGVAPASFGVSHAMDRPIWNYSIMHDPEPAERQLMDDWIRDLVAFINDEPDYQYGTRTSDEYKVMTPAGKIEIQRDPRWEELLDLAEVFSGSASSGVSTQHRL